MADDRAVRTHAKKLRDKIHFSSESLSPATNAYVAWLDIMGAGHLMSTSVHKSANCLVRLHMAVELACQGRKFSGRLLPINDGIFIVSQNKSEVMGIMQHALAVLVANFIAIPRPHDRFLAKGAIAFGPVYMGRDLRAGIKAKKLRESATLMEQVLFGPPIIQAYKSEASAPPYGVAIHESARAFAPDGSTPFRMTHWLWWQKIDDGDDLPNFPPLTDMKDCLLGDLQKHFEWMESSLIFHGIDSAKIKGWRSSAEQYFSMG
jgi:hypothetical protein